MRSIKLALCGFLIFISSTFSSAQDSLSTRDILEVEIGEEISKRIPLDQMSSFLLARDRVLKKYINDSIPIYASEIGINKEVISIIPSDELFDFLAEKGYIEVIEEENIGSRPSGGSGSPSPK